MKKSVYFVLTTFIGLGILLSSSCEKKPIGGSQEPAGKLKFNFEHYVDGSPVVINAMNYTNAAGNQYLIYEAQYFVTDMVIYKHDGSSKMIKDWTDYHYVDTNIPSTFLWEVYDSIPIGEYDSIAFHFGFTDSKNISYMFSNIPEKNMIWTEPDGGGYHYMKINGKWLDTNNSTRGFAFHLGRGQHYNASGLPIPPYIDNSFRVSLPGSDFTIDDGKITEITIRMNIEKWFKEPNIYDHNQWGGDIMEKQPAIKLAIENGWNVFSVN